MQKHIFLAIFLSIISYSCDKAQRISNDYEFYQITSNCNKIIIKSKKANETEGAMDISSFESKNAFIIKNAQQIENLNGILKQVSKTDYCCCPQTNYSISFYNNDENIGTYYADTIEFKNKVRIFETSYQYSFIIEKEFWKNYLKELELKN